MYKNIKFIIFFLITTYSFLFSAPHISRNYRKNQPKDKVKINKEKIFEFDGLSKVVLQSLNIGKKNIAVIVVDFPDKNFSSNWIDINSYFESLKQYYTEVSYNKLDLDITFFYENGFGKSLSSGVTPYRMPRSISYYSQNNEETLSQLVKDSLFAANGLVNKSSFNYVMVLHAGYGAETSNSSGDIWSVYVDWDKNEVFGFSDGMIVPEKEYYGASPLGVICHEFAHQLGLPDLYYGNNSIVGIWCLMDYGCWAGNPPGSSPTHLSSWCKKYLGWIDVEKITYTTNVNLEYIESFAGAVKIEIISSNNPEKEYFLIEYRKKIGFDISLPYEGVLIWKIDDNIALNPIRLINNDINSGSPNLAVDLIEADKTKISNSNIGDAGDPFPGIYNITNFIPSEYNIFSFNNQPIPIFIKNITKYNSYCVFDVLYNLELSGLSYAELKIANNYTYPGGLVLIGFKLQQPSEVEILVFDLSGKLVKNFGKKYYENVENTIQYFAKDDEGKNLQSGLYFVVMKTNNIHKVEKLIIKK